jgi:uncharacterized protein YukE
MTDNKDLWSKYDAASRKLKQGATSGKGGQGFEKEYADSYQALVRAGEALQLRKKYRVQ